MQTLRGKMWRTFLGLEAVKQEGYYEQLVHQALGNKYSKRKVRVLQALCLQNIVLFACLYNTMIDTAAAVHAKQYMHSCRLCQPYKYMCKPSVAHAA